MDATLTAQSSESQPSADSFSSTKQESCDAELRGPSKERQSETPSENGSANGQDSEECLTRAVEVERANAVTHFAAAAIAVGLGGVLVFKAYPQDPGLAFACVMYTLGVLATFFFSALSHSVFHQPLLNTMRAWDQAMIYAMISGTYTPIIYRFAPEAVRMPLLIAIWVAAAAGIVAKLIHRHRINNATTITYLMLGWLPAIPMIGQVPMMLGLGMLLGGVIYSVGVIVLVNDHRAKYAHVLWHLMVMAAAYVHYQAIDYFVLG